MKAYLANSLFSLADQAFNAHLASELRQAFPELELYCPQENEVINDKTSYANSRMISRGDDEHLLQCDFLIAVIDGVEIDSGVACEIGRLSGFDLCHQLRCGEKPRPIFALFTDCRQQGRDNMKKLHALSQDAVENQFPYRNLYVIGTIKDSGGCVSSSIEQIVDNIGKYIKSRS
jgi:hypothetical protein